MSLVCPATTGRNEHYRTRERRQDGTLTACGMRVKVRLVDQRAGDSGQRRRRLLGQPAMAGRRFLLRLTGFAMRPCQVRPMWRPPAQVALITAWPSTIRRPRAIPGPALTRAGWTISRPTTPTTAGRTGTATSQPAVTAG